MVKKVQPKSRGTQPSFLTNLKPYLTEVIPTVKQSGIRVNAISLGTEAIEGVEMISLETGGTNSFATSAQEQFLLSILFFSHW